MAVPADRLFESRGLDRLRITNTFQSSLGVPISYVSSMWDNLAPSQERVPRGAFDSLTAHDTPRLVPRIFEGNTGLLDTLRELDGSDSSIATVRSIDARFLQFGHKALIAMFDAKRTHKREHDYFVAYISREPEGSKLDAEALQDFNNLSTLHDAWESRVSGHVKEKFTVTRPLATAQFSYNGKEYRYFTMTYLPFREIAIEFLPYVTSDDMLVDVAPYVKYNIGVDDKQASAVAQVQFDAAASGDASPWIAKRHDLVLCEALVYLVTDGRWPAAEHLIGAGDINAVMTKHEGFSTMGITTVRGGFLESPSWFQFEKTFVKRMREHLEYTFHPLLRQAGITMIAPFGDMEDRELKSILNEAKMMVKR